MITRYQLWNAVTGVLYPRTYASLQEASGVAAVLALGLGQRVCVRRFLDLEEK